MKVSNHCYMISGLSAESPWAVNSGFIVGSHTTLIVDTGSNYLGAKTIYGYAVCANPDNRIMVVNTEPHYDHIGGNSFFLERNIDIFAHPELRRTEASFQANKDDFNFTIQNRQRALAYEADAFFFHTELANPNRPLIDGDEIDLGGVHVSTSFTPGHTPLNISLFVQEDGVLFCGDAVVTDYIPNLEGGESADWQNWLRSLDAFERLAAKAVVPGHGDLILGDDDIRYQLERMKTVLRTAIDTGKAPTSS